MAVRWPDDHDTVEPVAAEELRRWFESNHQTADAVWVMSWKKASGRLTISWSEAVDEALCVGWIDTKIQPIDDDRYVQYFTRRRAGSVWSKINKDKVERLRAETRMTPAGEAVIERAIADGSWTALDAMEAMVVPDDLRSALAAHPGSEAFYESLSNTRKRSVLRWIYTAKRPDTRAARIAESAAELAEGRHPRE